MEHHNISTHTVSRETYQSTLQLYQEYESQLHTYIDRLLWWNERINLVSRNVSRGTIKKHLLHSLLLSQIKLFKSSSLVVDAGTGGGLPGLPLAISHPKKQFLLNDIVSKKCLAVKQMVRKVGLTNCEIKDLSIQEIQLDQPFLLISKHAFKINDLYKMTSHLPWESMILYKGLSFKEELKGISTPLCINSYDLTDIDPFYKGKAIVIISKQ